MNPAIIGVGAVAALALLNRGKKNEEGGDAGFKREGSGSRVFQGEEIKVDSLIFPGSTVEGAMIQKEMLTWDPWLARTVLALAYGYTVRLESSGIATKGWTNTSYFSFDPKDMTVSHRFAYDSAGSGADSKEFLNRKLTKDDIVTNGKYSWWPDWNVDIIIPTEWQGNTVYCIHDVAGSAGKRAGFAYLFCPADKSVCIISLRRQDKDYSVYSHLNNGRINSLNYVYYNAGKEVGSSVDPDFNEILAKLKAENFPTGIFEKIPWKTIALCVAVVALSVAVPGVGATLATVAKGALVSTAIGASQGILNEKLGAEAPKIFDEFLGNYNQMDRGTKTELDEVVSRISQLQGILQ